MESRAIVGDDTHNTLMKQNTGYNNLYVEQANKYSDTKN